MVNEPRTEQYEGITLMCYFPGQFDAVFVNAVINSERLPICLCAIPRNIK